MQNTNESTPKTSIFTEKLFSILKRLIFMVIVWMLYRTFNEKQPNIYDIIRECRNALVWQNLLKGILVVVLIVVNWGFEAKKWQILAHRIEKISFIEAFKGVLIGLSLGFITPANLGDFAGRIWKFKNGKRVESIGAVLLNNGIQFYITLFFGLLGFLRFLFFTHQLSLWTNILLLLLMVFSLLLGIFVYWNKQILKTIILKIPLIRRFEGSITIMEQYTNTEILTALWWGCLRYLTISLQFVLVLTIFRIKVDYMDLWAITFLIFLVKTAVPALNFLSDLGVREYSALYFFSFYAVSTPSIITATFVLWLLNILLPVLIGSYFMLTLRRIVK